MIPEIGTIIVGGLVIAVICKVCGAIKDWWKSDVVQGSHKICSSILLGIILCGVIGFLDETSNLSTGEWLLMIMITSGVIWVGLSFAFWIPKDR